MESREDQMLEEDLPVTRGELNDIDEKLESLEVGHRKYVKYNEDSKEKIKNTVLENIDCIPYKVGDIVAKIIDEKFKNEILPLKDEVFSLKKELDYLKKNLRNNSISSESESEIFSPTRTLVANDSMVMENPFEKNSFNFYTPITSPTKNVYRSGNLNNSLMNSPLKRIDFNRSDNISIEPDFHSFITGNINSLWEKLNKIDFFLKEKNEKKAVDFKELPNLGRLVNCEKESLPYEEEKCSSNLNGLIISKLFQKISNVSQDSNRRISWEPYVFSSRVIKKKLSLQEWLNSDISLGESSDGLGSKSRASTVFNNKFNPIDLEGTFSGNDSKDLFLGTGAGKSTIVVRCIACHNKKQGVSVVVPNRSLIGSFLNAHNKWLAKGKNVIKDESGRVIDDPEERVTKCQICSENHTKDPYEVIHNGESDLINVFTWDELMKSFILKDKRKIIKKIIIFDEAHVDDCWYKKTISFFKDINKTLSLEGEDKYKIICTSATFSHLPSSSHLTGSVSDYYVNPKSILDFCQTNPEFLSKKIVVFCSKQKLLNLKVLDDNKIGYLVLNDELMDYATDIVRSTTAKIIIADSNYSLGFNFGDVNVISTGYSSRKVIKEQGNKFIFESEEKTSGFSDLIQERGRLAREKNHSGIWVSFLLNTNKKENKGIGEEKSNLMFKVFKSKAREGIRLLSELDETKHSSNLQILEAFETYQLNKKDLSQQDKENSFIYFRDIFFKSLCDNFMNRTFLEKKNNLNRIEPVFTLESNLISVFKDIIKEKDRRIELYKSIIRVSTWEMIKNSFELRYAWAERTQFHKSDDDYENCFKFEGKSDVEKAAFIFSLRDSEKCYTVTEDRNNQTNRWLVKIKIDEDFIKKNISTALELFSTNEDND